MITRGSAELDPVADDGWSPNGRHRPRELAPSPLVGADFGFRRNSSAAAVAVPVGRSVRLLGWVEWRPGAAPLRPSHVFRGVVDFAREHRADRAFGDGHYRDAALEVFDAEGLVFEAAPTVPSVAFLRVQHLLREGRIEGLDAPGRIIGPRQEDPAGLLVRQLEQVREVHEPGGHTRIELPRSKDGRHCDVAAAAVLALWAASTRVAASYAAPLGGSLVRA